MLGQGARSTLPFAVDASGNYALRVRYAAGPDGPFAQQKRTMTLAIAGGASRQVEFPATGAWNQWGEVTLPISLAAGTTDVSLTANAGDTAWVNLDSATLVTAGSNPNPNPTVSPSPTPPTTQGCVTGGLCEVETGTRAGGANVSSGHAGFTGSGFVEGLVSAGASVTNTVAVPTSGAYVVTLRYTAGPDGPSAGTDRTASLVVNGTPQIVNFAKTASWGAWATMTAAVTLPQGTSTIAVSVAQGNTGWVNVDSLRIDPASTPAPIVKVDAKASTRMIGGKAYVTVQARNTSAVPVRIDIVTAYGKKTFPAVQPGAMVSAATNSAKSSIPTGKATATATATVDGNVQTASAEASYNAQN